MYQPKLWNFTKIDIINKDIDYHEGVYSTGRICEVRLEHIGQG